ncbi:MAG TPA: hypothetical protein VL418_08395 [Devosiaceae bacterium]|nr:hypothetical protein [Devosiaceae bacterium]
MTITAVKRYPLASSSSAQDRRMVNWEHHRSDGVDHEHRGDASRDESVYPLWRQDGERPDDMKKVMTKPRTTAAASRFWPALGGSVERTKCGSSEAAASVFTVGAGAPVLTA